MVKIQPLDSQVVKQLKASVTIITLEQCLEELVKNALDAGATAIDVKVDLDQFMIQVEDNGEGILPFDLPHLAQRHVTSKCHTLIDLHGARTFGYRGEALASLAALSILNITTRHKSSTDTYTATWKDSRLIQYSQSTNTHKPGTIVLIPSLFYKLPIRQRNQNTSFDSLKHTLTLFALIFPQISFTLTDNKRHSKRMVTKKFSSSFGIFQSYFDQQIAQTIKPYSIQDNQVRLQGYFGDGVPTKAHQYIYVNRHYIPPSSCELYKIVSSTIKNYSSKRLAEEHIGKRKEHPLFLIKIECACLTSYSIPYLGGHAIYSRLETLLKRLVLRYLRSVGKFEAPSLVTQTPPRKKQHTTSSSSKVKTYGLNLEHTNAALTRNHYTPPYQKTGLKYPLDSPKTINTIDRSRLRQHIDPIMDSRFILNTPHLPSLTSSSPTRQSLPGLKSVSSASQTATSLSGSKHTSTVTLSSTSSLHKGSSKSNNIYGLQAPKKLQRQDLDYAKVIGQVDRKWIMCLLDRMLLLIDQHAADERVKLENMLDKDLDVRYLQPHLVLPTTEHDLDLAMKHRSTLQHWGIHVEHSGLLQQHTLDKAGGSPHFSYQRHHSPHFTTAATNKTWFAVTRLPSLILERCVLDPNLLSDLIHNYLNGLETRTITCSVCPPGMMDILKSKACRGAIMFNDSLTMEQCSGLIKSLAKCRFPFQCAHGRPSVVPLITMDDHKQQYISRPIRWDRFVK
ncbi:hypothetical protein BC941DRAFT_428482 [Chlamydoabsidia padenii]|nr:hypothetical protein BC941DRAFT_428482 [Chlamydoabsidia padenii]